MPHNTNFQIINVDPLAANELVVLGDTPKDQVNDFSVNSNTIILGQGAGDSVNSGTVGDNITLGDGKADMVNLSGNGAILSTVTLGDGANDRVIIDGFVDGSGDNLVSVGNGANDFVSTNGFSDIIHMGTGAGDEVQLAEGFETVSFGGAKATLNLSADLHPSFFPPTTMAQTSVSTTELNIISGLVKGDHIVLAGGLLNTDTLATTSNLAGVAHEAALTAGTYDSVAATFTESAVGADALLTYDTPAGGFVSVVLVGAAHEIPGSVIHSGTVALG
jgi:hypothetical protein